MLAWNKRLRSPTLRAIAQNQSLGARYFPYEVMAAPTYVDVEALRIEDAVDVLEELANHGRCLVALPGEERLALYYVDAETGRSRLAWYEPSRRLIEPSPAQRWRVTLEVEGARDSGDVAMVSGSAYTAGGVR
jgi:hypothetical protein